MTTYNERLKNMSDLMAEKMNEHFGYEDRTEEVTVLAALAIEEMAIEVNAVWTSNQYLRGAKSYISSIGLVPQTNNNG